MSKKYLEAMAADVREQFDSASNTNDVQLARDLRQRALGCMFFAIRLGEEFNPRFDSDRFQAACGYDANFGEFKS